MTHQIDVSRGQCIGTVSQQWANRGEDERFTSLSALRAQVDTWANESFNSAVLPSKISAFYDETQPDLLGLRVGDTEVDATHFGFDHIARVANAPANYLRSLPGALAAVNLNYGLQTAEPKEVACYLRNPEGADKAVLRAITSTRYGRILDREVVDAVMRVAGDGVGDTRWKVPGTIEWGSKFGISYNPNVDITKQNTTLYASDRDVFLFLVDDMNPIEVGKLANGEPDLMFRGFYVWNSEVGGRTFGFASMYLRGVCQNRNLWGVEGFNEITFKHVGSAPSRFENEAAPALLGFANNSQTRLVQGVKAAKDAKVASTDEDRLDFLARFGFSERQANKVVDTCLIEEGTKPESVWDFAQGITALARAETYQENRLKLEQVAGKLLDRVKVPA